MQRRLPTAKPKRAMRSDSNSRAGSPLARRFFGGGKRGVGTPTSEGGESALDPWTGQRKVLDADPCLMRCALISVPLGPRSSPPPHALTKVSMAPMRPNHRQQPQTPSGRVPLSPRRPTRRLDSLGGHLSPRHPRLLRVACLFNLIRPRRAAPRQANPTPRRPGQRNNLNDRLPKAERLFSGGRDATSNPQGDRKQSSPWVVLVLISWCWYWYWC